MITATRETYKRKWFTWVRKRNRPGNPQTLDSRNLYILPSKFGWAFGVIVMVFLIGAINYQINTIFLMAFLLAIVGMASAVEAHANLLNLSFKFIDAQDAEVRTPVKITLQVDANNKNRFSVNCGVAKQSEKSLETIPDTGLQFVLPIETTKRGYFSIPRIVLTSLFPFGIFTV